MKTSALKTTGSTSLSHLEKRLHLADFLLKLSNQMSAFGNLDDVLNAFVEIATRELNAERGTIFLNDSTTNELYSRVAQGHLRHEIRILNSSGIAGSVFTAQESLIILDPYADPRFNQTIDEQTGFATRSILCVPIRTGNGEVIGVAQLLNKQKGRFTKADLTLLEKMTRQASLALQNAQFIENMRAIRAKEVDFLNVISEVTSDINISSLLKNVMSEITRMLNADRSTLFLNDEKTGQLWSEVGQGLASMQIRLPNHLGIAGAVFTSGKVINIPHAYADLRFNPAFDKKTGYFTRSLLCVLITNKEGKVIGVTQVLNKHGGPFNQEDESRLKVFSSEISIALQNAKLFADVQSMKNYNESMLESMSSGVLTLDETEQIVTCNAAGLRILQTTPAEIVEKPFSQIFYDTNAWVLEKVKRVMHTGEADITVDASIADQLLATGADSMGGVSVPATVLFSDIRGFTTITEELGPQATVSMLNEYFEIMVDCLRQEDGMLDKFIGDAVMAAFGIPVAHSDDEDRAVRTSISMITRLADWNVIRLSEGKKPINIGIGLNTDVVVSGNIGAKKRMDYTIIGDGVNLAARLESACKQYAAKILISEFTQKKLRGTYRMREVDLVVVKGKTQPVAVFEVLDYHTEQTFPNLMDVVSHFRDGIAKYRRGEFDLAIKAFDQALGFNPNDTLSQIYIERCNMLQQHPPEGVWDGVWRMEGK